jgi:hypothetical protein
MILLKMCDRTQAAISKNNVYRIVQYNSFKKGYVTLLTLATLLLRVLVPSPILISDDGEKKN